MYLKSKAYCRNLIRRAVLKPMTITVSILISYLRHFKAALSFLLCPFLSKSKNITIKNSIEHHGRISGNVT